MLEATFYGLRFNLGPTRVSEIIGILVGRALTMGSSSGLRTVMDCGICIISEEMTNESKIYDLL